MIIKKLKNSIYTLLRKSQGFTGTDNVYVAKYGSYLTIGNIASIVIALTLSVIFARLLTKEIYGQYQYILSLVNLLAIFSLPGINHAITQGVAQGNENVFIKGLVKKIQWGFYGSLASVCVAIYFFLQNNITFTIVFFIIALFLPFFKAGESYQFYLDGKKLFGHRIVYTTIVQFIATLSIILTLLITKNLIALILVYFASYSILRMIIIWRLKPKKQVNSSNDNKMITYGKRLSILHIISTISQQVDKILLYSFLGPASLAIYSFAILPVEQLRSPLKHLKDMALPKLTVRSSEEIKKTLPRKLLKSLIFISAIIILYILIAPYFFKILYPQYTEAIFYSRLFALTLFVFPMSMMTLALQAKMKIKSLYVTELLNPIVRIILFAILIPIYGILGIIITMLLSQVIFFFTVWYFFKRM